MMGNGFGMGWWWLFGLVLLVGLVLLIVVLVRMLGGASGSPPPDASGYRRPAGGRARDILDERYARGELTTEEYRERLQVLGQDP